MNPTMRKAVAEFVGTLALIYVGVLVLVAPGPKNLVEVALAHGLVIGTMVSATMMISGGQINPAVTLALLVGRKIDGKQAGVNILAQLIGGTVGGYLALWSLGGVAITGGVPDLAAGVTTGQGILIEVMLTFFLMFVIYGTAVDERFGARLGGLAIGLTVALDILAGGPLTGAAMNPARWLGAAIPAGHFDNALVYWVGPIAGAVVAALVWEFLLTERTRGSVNVEVKEPEKVPAKP